MEFLQILGSDVIVVPFATSSPKIEDPLSPKFDIFNPLYLDTVDFPPVEKPPGQLRILSVVNLHVCVVNQVGHVSFVPLSQNPYILFVMEIIGRSFDKAKFIY